MHRRQFLVRSALAAAGGLVGAVPARPDGDVPARTLAFLNIHTGERLRATYWEQGAYVPDALAGIDALLRDYRTGDVARIDPRLLDLLHALSVRLEARSPFHLISGYRSPLTNASLRAQGRRVAKSSLHMKGMAADIRLPGVPLLRVRDAARALRSGGVGCYPQPDFVHVDVGRIRYW
jgi:uncharacterized protein YcbK (DUF882 family)